MHLFIILLLQVVKKLCLDQNEIKNVYNFLKKCLRDLNRFTRVTSYIIKI